MSTDAKTDISIINMLIITAEFCRACKEKLGAIYVTHYLSMT
nr:MAG TPA: Protein of unknown function (DUF1244) [Caudoviricetes sp.]